MDRDGVSSSIRDEVRQHEKYRERKKMKNKVEKSGT